MGYISRSPLSDLFKFFGKANEYLYACTGGRWRELIVRLLKYERHLTGKTFNYKNTVLMNAIA